MLQDADFLFTVAEVAVAFAGFASIVAAIGQRSTRDDPTVDAARLRGLVECSLVVVAFALLPYALSRVSNSESVAWQIASAGFATVAAMLTVGMLRRTRSIDMTSVPLRIRVMVISLYLAPLPFLLWVAVGVGPSEIYLLCLLSYLFAAGVAFLRVMLSFITAVRSGDGDAG